MLKHPLRRTEEQCAFLAVVQAQDRGDLKCPRDKLAAAVLELEEWEMRAHSPENLVKDFDALYFFNSKNGIKDLDLDKNDPDYSPECFICRDPWDEYTHAPGRPPCGHVGCRECFSRWLEQSQGTYTCALCRSCLVCGTDGCSHHVIHEDRAPPFPLPEALDHTLPDKKGELLHGFEPGQYLVLRERTREDRALLSWIGLALYCAGLGAEDPVRARLDADCLEVSARITKAVEEALRPSHENWI